MREAVKKALIVIIWLLIWQAASIAIGNTLLLAGPIDTLVRLVSDVVTVTFWSSIAFSAVRIVSGFVMAFALALILGTIAWRVTLVRDFLAPAVSFIKSVPVVCIIVLLLVWMGSAWISVIAVALMVFPPVYANYLEGLKQADEQMVQMLDVFEFGPWQRLRYYYLPLVLPFIASAAKVVVGISWKAGIAAEVIGIPNGSIGAGIYLSKIGLDTAGLFSWTLVIVLFSVICEIAFLKLLKCADNWTRRLAHTKANAFVEPDAHKEKGKSATAFNVSTSDDKDFKTESKTISTHAYEAKAASGNDSNHETLEEKAVGGITFDNVSFGYTAKRPIFKDYSYAFVPGGKYCLMAPSGAGKSTLLSLASGLINSTSGKISRPQRVSVMFQENRLLDQLSAWDNVRLTSALPPAKLTALKSDLDKILDWDSANLSIASCSGGMARKIALVRALAAPGEALFLDEPFAGMDDTSKADAITLINNYACDRTLLVVTHDSDDALPLKAEITGIPSAQPITQEQY